MNAAQGGQRARKSSVGLWGLWIVLLGAPIGLGDRAAAQPAGGTEPLSEPAAIGWSEHRVLFNRHAPGVTDVMGGRTTTVPGASELAADETISLTGRSSGAIWGSGIYTSDSDLATAAVHAGVLKEGETGRVWITRLPGLESYRASTRHGVTSRPWGAWSGSVHLQRADDAGEPESPAVNLSELRGQLGHVITLTVTGRTTGALWGTEVYTDDSDIGTAAVHAGLLREGERGRIQITILPGRRLYRGSEQNGVTSHPYESWGGSFWMEPAP